MNDASKTEDDIERYLRRVEKLRSVSDFSAALDACRQLIAKPETKAAGLRARADIYADMNQRDFELADREALVDHGSKEPSDHFDLGVGLWRSGRIAEATTAFARSIELGELESFHYYTNVSRMRSLPPISRHLEGEFLAVICWRFSCARVDSPSPRLWRS